MSRSRHARGHTLAELVISLALIAALSGVAAVLLSTARRDDRVAQDYANDLRHMRGASNLLTDAIRSASVVGAEDGVLITDGVRWTVSDGSLRRDDDRVIHGISSLEAKSVSARLWTVGVAPIQRRDNVRAPLLSTTVRARCEATR